MKSIVSLCFVLAFAFAGTGCTRTSPSSVTVAPEKVTVKEVQKFEVFANARGAVISGNGRTVAIVNPETKLLVARDLGTGKETKIDMGTQFPKVILSSNGRYLAARTDVLLPDGDFLAVWDLETGKEIHRAPSSSLQFKFSASSTYLAYAEPESNTVKVVTLGTLDIATIRHKKAIWDFSFEYGYKVIVLNTGDAWEIVPGSLCSAGDDSYAGDGALLIQNWNPIRTGHPINDEVQANLAKRKK